MKLLFKSISVLGLGALLLTGCKDKEAELLTPRLYFESLENSVVVESGDNMSLELKSRLSTKTTQDVKVTYSIGDESLVNEFNARFGKEYKAMPAENISLSSEGAVIAAGNIYSEKVDLQVSNLSSINMGETFLVPVCVNTTDVTLISGSEVTYYVLNKPVQIKKVAQFSNSYIKLDLTPLDVFQEVTYEATVCVDYFGANNTVMGCEGVMIMRIGDAGGGTVPKDILQVAGGAEMTWTGNPLKTGQWYHLAFTCTGDGKAKLFVNGNPVIDGSFKFSSDLTSGGADFGFSIGKVPGFMWGERPFYGKMCEVRLWNVVRSPSQIKESMLSVDPKTPGLVGYFKLDGAVKNYAEGGKPAKAAWGVNFTDLSKPVEIGASIE